MKRLFLILSITLLYFLSKAQNNDSTALIIIDIQDFYFPGGKAELVEPEKAAEQARLILDHLNE